MTVQDEIKAGEFVGNYILPDGWKSGIGENLEKSDGFKDSSFPGSDYRLPLPNCGGSAAVNVKITGRKIIYRGGNYSIGWKRCKVEWVRDDNEPSEFSGAWIALERNY